jgi:hypothetical protein
MRISTRLLALPLLIVSPGFSEVGGQSARATNTAAENDAASVRWNRLVPKFLEEASARRRAARTAAAGDSAALRKLAQTPPPMQFRVYTVLSLAQYAAANSAGANRAVSADAAVAAASAAALADMLTDSAVRASIARELDRDLAQLGAADANRAIASRRLGEEVARRVIAWAPPVNFAAGGNVVIPTGPGMWYTAKGVPPAGAFFGKSRTWLLDSAAQFRPAPPPAFNSPEFKASLEEVQRVARERTPEQTKIAKRWSDADPWTEWNEIAASALRRNRFSELNAARVLAVLNIAALDAVAACFEAKYHYWTIRPSQVDTALALAEGVPLPNFPSYPSGHACSAGAFDGVMGYFFPKERADFTRIAEEQAMSRLYGGIHFRFDNDIGLALGRQVARHAIEAERRGRLTAWRTAQAGSKR